MHNHVTELKQTLEPIREKIIHHPTYTTIKDLSHLQMFMQHHVFAVWDFMSLLKSLQNQLTCTSVPWYPVGDANTRFLFNEIVVGEESDVDQHGKRISHFELYIRAMHESAASTELIDQFLEIIVRTNQVDAALKQVELPHTVREFVTFTFETIHSKKPHVLAAVFTFGREDLIPGMFHQLVNDLHERFPTQIETFKYYLDRHIEVDGGHHSHLALEMTSNLCGNDPEKWNEAKLACIKALQLREQLWNGVYQAIQSMY